MRKSREMNSHFYQGDQPQQNPYFNPDTQQQQYHYPVQNQQQYYGQQYEQQPQQQPTQDGNYLSEVPLMQNPVLQNMAKQYAGSVVADGSAFAHKTVDKYISISNLRYYFDVDNAYVAKKLSLILFPFVHTKWSIKYDQSGPIPPRNDINALDLYIPAMALITYVLVSGMVLGTQERFSPEQLGISASQSLVWLTLEIVLLNLVLYFLNIRTSLAFWDLVAFSSYKFVSMVAVLLAFFGFSSFGYYIALAYTSLSLAVFLIRSLKLHVLPNAESSYITTNSMDPGGYNFDESPAAPPVSVGGRRGIYILLIIAVVEPFVMWWLTSGVTISGMKSQPTIPAASP